MTPARDDNAALALSSSSSDTSRPPSPRARSASTSTSTSRTTAGSTSTHTTATSTTSAALASPTSPSTTASRPPDTPPRKGRWTAAEHAEVLRSGDAAGPGAAWDALRRSMTGDARLRSAAALRARYLQLVSERRDREEEREGGEGEGEADLKVGEEDEEDAVVPEGGGAGAHEMSWSPPGTQSTSGELSPPSRLVSKVHPAVVALPKPSLFRPPTSPLASSISPSALSFPPAPPPAPLAPYDPQHPPPWSIDEDTALLTAMATPQLGAQTWAGMHALAARVYRLGPGEGREWTRSEREVQRRWDGVLRDGEFAPLRWPDAIVPPLLAIHAVLTETLQAQLDATDPRLAASLRRTTLPRPPAPTQPAHAQSPSPAPAAAPKPLQLGSPVGVRPAAAHHSPTATATAPSSSPSTTARRSSAPHLASSPHAALAQGRAAPPFPARNSPLAGPSALPLPRSPYTPHIPNLGRPLPPPPQQQQPPPALYQARPLPLSVPLGPAYHPRSSLSTSTSFSASLPPSTPTPALPSTSSSASAASTHARPGSSVPPMRLAPTLAPAPAPAPTSARPEGAYGVLDVERAHVLGLGRDGGGGELAHGGGSFGAAAAAGSASRSRLGYDVGASWSALMGAGAGAGAAEGDEQGRKRALSVSTGAGAGAGLERWWEGEEGGAEGSAAKRARRESA